MKQLAFDLPGKPALGRGDFFVSPGNQAVVDAIENWRGWPQGKLVLVGAEGSGKTHLAHVWAAAADARIVKADSLSEAGIPSIAAGASVIEDADRIAGEPIGEAALFHLHNLALANAQPLLVTARMPPARWGLSLPDLKSRMQGSAIAALAAPDDALLSAVLVKLFADRQLAVDAGLIAYLIKRMDRSFAGAGQLVDALDHSAMESRRSITKELARHVLDNLDMNAQ